MKRKMFITVACMWAAMLSLFAVNTEIECEVYLIDRSLIHPSGPYEASQTSGNWSGYASADAFNSTANGTVSYVAGSWIVPTLSATSNNTFCSMWVGIDGLQTGTVEQIGTSHNWVNGRQQNYAWFEMYPRGSYSVNLPVAVGDVMSATVSYIGNNTFQLILHNQTQGLYVVVPTAYTQNSGAARRCAEWIVEAPFSGGTLPLSDFQVANFSHCSTTINGLNGSINNSNWLLDKITMIGRNGVKAQPSFLSSGGSGFQVTWQHE